MSTNNNYDRDNLESTLRYLAGEYGVESLAGQGKIRGMENAILLMHDFYNTRFHTKEYNLLKMMEQTGILRRIVELKDSSDASACKNILNACVDTLEENFIRRDIAVEYVNMIAGIAGLKSRADAPSKSNGSVNSVQQVAAQPSQPAQQGTSSSGGSSNIETVSAETLLKDYISNIYKAQKKYQGKTIEVRGKIDEITTEGTTPVVVFSMFLSPYVVFHKALCYISTNDPLLADIEKNGYATIRGYVSEINTTGCVYGYNNAYKLTDCKIISAN